MSKELFEQQQEWDSHENIDRIPLEFTEENKPALFGIDEEKAQGMVSGLSTTIAEREVLKNAYIDVIELEVTAENLPIFKELRLKFVKNRTTIEKWHKVNKEFYLNGGRFVDAIKNKEIAENKEIEEKLMEAEKFFENQEKAKAKSLNDARIEKIKPYVENAEQMDFKEFNDEDFEDFVFGKKTKQEQRIAEEKAELERIENERIAEAKRIEEQRLENEKLRAESEKQRLKLEAEEKERQRIAKIEADKLAKERAESLAKQKAIQDEADKKALAEKQKQDAILKAEREAKAKIEAELQAKKDAEIKAENEENERVLAKKLESEKLAKAPVKKQLTVWVDTFTYGLPLDNATSKDIVSKFEAFKKWAKSEIEKL